MKLIHSAMLSLRLSIPSENPLFNAICSMITYRGTKVHDWMSPFRTSIATTNSLRSSNGMNRGRDIEKTTRKLKAPFQKKR